MFEARAHHAFNFLVASEITYRREGMSGLQAILDAQIQLVASNGVPVGNRLQKKIPYSQDVFGQNPANSRVRAALESCALGFIATPQASFVRLTSWPDSICKSCAVGSHCPLLESRSKDVQRISSLGRRHDVLGLDYELGGRSFDLKTFGKPTQLITSKFNLLKASL